jgi:hypothetical protein
MPNPTFALRYYCQSVLYGIVLGDLVCDIPVTNLHRILLQVTTGAQIQAVAQ